MRSSFCCLSSSSILARSSEIFSSIRLALSGDSLAAFRMYRIFLRMSSYDSPLFSRSFSIRSLVSPRSFMVVIFPVDVFLFAIFYYFYLRCLVYVGILFKSFRPSGITTMVRFKYFSVVGILTKFLK